MASVPWVTAVGRKRSKSSWVWTGLLVALTWSGMLGCTKAPPAEFELNMVTMTKYDFGTAEQERIASVLVAMFGTPDQPFVLPETGLDITKLRRAAGPVGTDSTGAQVGLYRRHCAHCHGITGDGMGPTARFLNPYPRDYRQGVYKFKSTPIASEPTRADLTRTLHEGIPGTAMPSFLLLSSTDTEAIIEYVIYLSMRGQMEAELANLVSQMDEPTDEKEFVEEVATPEILVAESLTGIADKWSSAVEKVIRPDAELAPSENRTSEQVATSVAAGRALFFGERAACVKCHGRTALGDGQTTGYDVWNQAIVDFAISAVPPEKPAADATPEDRKDYENKVANYHLKEEVLAAVLPPRNLLPRNLRSGVYRGGRRPLDLYRRISSGIEGTPMPAGVTAGLTPSEIWQLVDYVKSLPFEAASTPPHSWNEWRQAESGNVSR
jgi:mono/diheme cytochrome c family protein